MIELRLKSKVSEEEIAGKVGHILEERDYNIVPTGDCTIRKPNGKILLVYRRGAIPVELRESVWPILAEFKKVYTANRGLAAGSERAKLASGKRSEGRRIPSAIIGAFDPQGPRRFCRLTAWTGRENGKWQELWPLLRFVGDRMKEDAPDRWQAQMREVDRTEPEWVVPGTPFSTVTVNNTYETGVHKDKGDLDAGISTLVVLRRGEFKGGVLVLPEYRVGVDMQDGDLLLMDAHEWHGNTWFDPRVERDAGTGRLQSDPGFERISVVSYFRTKMTTCGSYDSEVQKRMIVGEQRASVLVGE